MRWEDEAYVRIYLRDTPEWCALSWEARSLFMELMRKVDRAGVILTGKAGVRGLAGLIRYPIDVVERALNAPDGLLADGCVVAIEGGFIIPNYIPAQTAKQSDRARKQEQRSRERAYRLATTPGSKVDAVLDKVLADVQPVTNRDADVTQRDETSGFDDGGHAESHAVTLSLAERSEAKQISISDPPPLPPPTENPEPDAAAASGLVGHLVAALARHPETKPIAKPEWAQRLLASGVAVSESDIDEAAAWAARQLALDGAPGAGAPLVDRAIADRVSSGLVGAARKRRRGVVRGGPVHDDRRSRKQLSPEEFGDDGGWGEFARGGRR